MPRSVLINSIIIKCGAAHSSRLLRERREGSNGFGKHAFLLTLTDIGTRRAGRRHYLPLSRRWSRKLLQHNKLQDEGGRRLIEKEGRSCWNRNSQQFLLLPRNRLQPQQERKRSKLMPQSSVHCHAIVPEKRKRFLSSLRQWFAPTKLPTIPASVGWKEKWITGRRRNHYKEFLIQIAWNLRDRRSWPTSHLQSFSSRRRKSKRRVHVTFVPRQKSDVELRSFWTVDGPKERRRARSKVNFEKLLSFYFPLRSKAPCKKGRSTAECNWEVKNS